MGRIHLGGGASSFSASPSANPVGRRRRCVQLARSGARTYIRPGSRARDLLGACRRDPRERVERRERHRRRRRPQPPPHRSPRVGSPPSPRGPPFPPPTPPPPAPRGPPLRR